MPASGHAVLSRISLHTLSTHVNRVFQVGGELADLHDPELHQQFTAITGCASQRAAIAAALMLRVPFRAGASHVIELGPIGIAGDSDQPVTPRHDHVQVPKKRRR
jgi:hypothetical protein